MSAAEFHDSVEPSKKSEQLTSHQIVAVASKNDNDGYLTIHISLIVIPVNEVDLIKPYSLSGNTSSNEADVVILFFGSNRASKSDRIIISFTLNYRHDPDSDSFTLSPKSHNMFKMYCK